MKRYIFITLLLFSVNDLYSAVMIKPQYTQLKVFYSQSDIEGQQAELKGKIISFSSDFKAKPDELRERINIKSKACVRLYTIENVTKGDTLFVIDDDNLIVSRFTVTLIYKSSTFGYLLTGTGNFRLSHTGYRVVKKTESKSPQLAHIHVARGNYFKNTQQVGRAIKEYKTAISYDINNPEAHLALGSIYIIEKMYDMAYNEYLQAYKNIDALYDNEDKFDLLEGLVQVKFWEVYYSGYSSELKDRFRKEGIKYCKEALTINPLSYALHYYLGIFYFKNNPKPMYNLSKKHLLQVIKIQPSHSKAYSALAELYLIHDKISKARSYATKALQLDDKNQEARYILKNISR